MITVWADRPSRSELGAPILWVTRGDTMERLKAAGFWVVAGAGVMLVMLALAWLDAASGGNRLLFP